MSLASLIDELNPQQKQAATTESQHSLVLAGAGCGKTKTIVARAAYLIDQGIPANQIQILTFTRRSASEIVARVELALGEQAKGLRASTFHTFCMYLLRRVPKAFGLEQFSIIDRDDQLMMFRLIRGKDDKKNPNQLPKPQELCDLYSFARNTRQKLSDALEKQHPEHLAFKDQIAEIMKEYETRKRARSFLDYDDILAIVASALDQSDGLADYVASLCKHMLVDEMQDTNPLQWALLEPLKDKVSLFCVGDDAQSIYGFRGADFENIHHFKERVPNAQIFKLEQNYRSTQEILDLSNWLLDQSEIQYNKRLDAYRGEGIKPRMHVFPNEFDEAKWIAIDIKERHYLQGQRWSDHMVLVRSSFAARHIEAACIAANVPYRFIGGMKLLETAHVKDLLSLLRVIANPLDDIAWMRFLTLWNGVGDVGASRLAQQLLLEPEYDLIFDKLEKFGRIPAETVLIMKQMTVLKQEVQACVSLGIQAIEAQLAENYKKDWNRRQGDFELVKQLASKHTQLSEFLEEYVLDPVSISEIERQSDSDVVTLITIHSAKGTEQKVCYVVNVTPGQYPHARAQGNFNDVEEERRVLYVALTRAQNELILTKQNLSLWARDVIDEQGRKVESYFLNDLTRNLCSMETHHKPRQQTVKSALIERQSINLDFGINLD
ncbi:MULTISPECIES: ATP-dependent helicase [Acinetobacter]|jgi:DNA helicase II / ATP-dependent DNA helicase PcrA|uniref:DNA 3'-5' helicase n=3 Tax=Gammaproteobacteria TaxID=1236 RepID=A0AAJ6IBL6_ACIJO|nr:ATP-dependent helicase [Acinetobacter johnsonii]ALV73989.1 ATP-dependent DNA helicase PcrA [Acinetobacter johnsonii XBB1]MCV2450989.1 ATP-dependent helicase [Acinetobacter johnsonii]MDG9787230.1 ATP-dependent helicase [Acinetobacter johnsonii]MDG9800074.1 ATP-dependent helicase [Acinetobacter johnsonii]MDH1240548.1 ATP-dependent helicase [Acinetobacter johnsonii]